MKFLIIIIVLSSGLSCFANDRVSLFLESGLLWQARNDVQITPSTGTRFAIDDFDNSAVIHYRMEAFYKLAEKHKLRLVYAPSYIKNKNSPGNNIIFNNQTFIANNKLTTRYKFNSYRLSYLYKVWAHDKDYLNIGVTAKIRDAKIDLEQDGTRSTYDNLGFVPLFYLDYEKHINDNWSLNIAIDAAYAPQGRATDAAIKARYNKLPNKSFGLGIRTLEGGADNDKVFTFSWFNYLVLDMKLDF